jgi:hypothetical protein
MKSTGKLIIFVITFLAVAASAYAQPPREQLQQMVQQLQKSPNDNVLREKIIKLARTMRPAPAVPDTAQITDAKRRIAGLEFGIEKANTPEARAAKQKTRDDDLMKSLEGAVFSHTYTDVEVQYRISNGRAVYWSRRVASGGALCQSGAHMTGPIGEQMTCPDHLAIRLVGRRGESSNIFGPVLIEITEDGQTLLKKMVGDDKSFYDIVFKRQ